MIQKIKLLFNTIISNKQIKSFLKTFVVVFIAVAYTQIDNGGDVGTKIFWISALAAAIRNVIKTILGDFKV